ncbi:uncharacterized protein N7487_009634 [Penicillium crustosum]|uniref:uncharacterized protein n=1 Tax=Penicillium crustosum TaxID=36656 RepID=UPI0023A68F6B|nr:uncharacterized protein N7487_009634 [Penicillium crustosum]KAJ5395331.1 hypothetical protein N7487_009634 [Penicillium crustosum]
MTTSLFYSTFCLHDNPANISVYQSDVDTSHTLIASEFNSNSLFQEHISTTPLPKLRIMSSIKPLQISKDALRTLKDTYNIGNEIWDSTSTFGDKPLTAAVGEGGIKIKSGENGIQVSGEVHNWTMRQMAVFHHHDPNDLQNLWIFFHVGYNTPMQQEIKQYVSIPQQGLRSDHAWHLLHSAAFSSCLDNWRSYVNSLGYDVDKRTDQSLEFILRNIDHVLTAGGDRATNLTVIHNTRDLLVPTSYRLRVILDTLAKLGDLSSVLSSQHDSTDNGFQKLVTCVGYHEDHLEGCVVGVEVLKEKIKDILNMSTLGLDFRMTHEMLDLNNRMVVLNDRMIKTNKVVTFLTLIYLPASLMSSIFGMNLFKFDDGTTEKFKVSDQIWIFVVATIVLGFLTYVSWYLWSHKKQIFGRIFRFRELRVYQETKETSSDT